MKRATFAALALAHGVARADLPAHATVDGAAIDALVVGDGPRAGQGASRAVGFATLATTDVAPGAHWASFATPPGAEAALVPVCAGRGNVRVDDVAVPSAPGPLVVALPQDGAAHVVSFALAVSGYEHRVACGEPPRAGVPVTSSEGLSPFAFASPRASLGGGEAAVYVPPGHDVHVPGPLLVGLHPWNGSVWTYAAYAPLIEEARAKDVVLLLPSGLGNSLYTAQAEDEVLAAIAALEEKVAVDPARVTLWGASMGGAGATTVGFHHPDRFAAIVSLFGDSKYDLSTYVRGVLGDGSGAHLVNAFDVADNARNVPVWLVHGEDDRVSPLAQSAVLDRALRALHFDVTFDRVPGAGHEGRVVHAFASRIVDRAATARRVASPVRVSYRSVRASDTGAYGVRFTRARGAGDAFFDVALRGGAVHLVRSEGIAALHLPRGAFGLAPTEAPAVIVDDPASRGVSVAWDPLP
jgi:pimeloyl-ACP methyl ester carboxylesterase